MKNTTVFTTTIAPPLIAWLTIYAKKRKTTKRAILEEALITYKNETRKKELIASFQKAAKDKEIKMMTEEGFEDYNTQLKTLGL